MFEIFNDGTIRLTRGDTARIQVNILHAAGGQAYEIQPGDTLELSVKKDVRDSTYSVHKSSTGSNQIHINPEDTAGLAFGSYVYDVQLTTESGDVHTVVPPHAFYILEEVT